MALFVCSQLGCQAGDAADGTAGMRPPNERMKQVDQLLKEYKTTLSAASRQELLARQAARTEEEKKAAFLRHTESERDSPLPPQQQQQDGKDGDNPGEGNKKKHSCTVS
jgi:hypothetical protein